MSEKIFKNSFTLALKDKQIDERYHEHKMKNIYYYNKFFLLFLLAQSIFVTVFVSTKFNMFNLTILVKFPIVVTYIVDFFLLVFLIFEIKKIPSKYYLWAHNFAYYLTLFVNFNLRIVILRILKVDTNVTVYLFIVEILFRMVWMLLAFQTFVQCILLNFISLITLWILIPLLTPADIYSSTIMNTIAYTAGLFFVQIYQYFFERMNKQAFYYNAFSKRNSDWLTGVFENMNTGFIKIKSGKVSFVNSFLKNLLKNIYMSRKNNDYECKICFNFRQRHKK